MKLPIVCIVLIGLTMNACTSASRNDARLADAVKTQGDAFLLQGEYTAALSTLLEARKIKPDDPYLLNSLGLAYMGKNRDDLAIEVFKQALDLKPDYTEALNNLGAAYLRQKNWDLAIPAFKQVLEDLLYPTPQFPMSNLGWAYLGKKEYIQAESWFFKALDTWPGLTIAAHGLSQVLLETGRENDAIRFLKARLSEYPKAAILHADLARAYEAKGWTKNARQCWQNVLIHAKENTNLKKTATKRLSALD